MRRKDERSVRAERDGPYVISAETTIKVSEMALAAHTSVQKSSAASLTAGLVEHFRESTIQLFLGLFLEVAPPCGKNVQVTEVRLTFVKSGYMMRSIIHSVSGVDFETRFIKTSVTFGENFTEYPLRIVSVLLVRKNRFVLVFGGGEVSGGPCATKALL